MISITDFTNADRGRMLTLRLSPHLDFSVEFVGWSEDKAACFVKVPPQMMKLRKMKMNLIAVKPDELELMKGAKQ